MLVALCEQLALGGGVLVVGGHLGGDRLAQALGPIGRHLDAAVEVLDLGFELVGGDVALLAAGAVAAVLLAQAVEVGVGALRALDRESPPADPADENALQVVVVPALPVPRMARAASSSWTLSKVSRSTSGSWPPSYSMPSHSTIPT